MEELSEMYMWLADVLAVEETKTIGGVSVGDFSLAEKHEPIDASHGARIMAKEVGVSSFFNFLGTIRDKIMFQRRAIHEK